MKGPNDVAVMTDQRRVLFLRREGKGWKPAAWGGMQVSVVWVEAGQLYVFQQKINPGPTALHPLDLHESKLKAQVVEAVKIQAELLRAIADTLDCPMPPFIAEPIAA